MIKIDFCNFDQEFLDIKKEELLEDFYFRVSREKSSLKHLRCILKKITKKPVSIKKNIRDIIDFDFDFEKYTDDYYFYEYINFSEFYRQTMKLTTKNQREHFLLNLKRIAELPENGGFSDFDDNFMTFIEPTYFTAKINNHDDFRSYIDNELFSFIKVMNEELKLFFKYDTYISSIRASLLNAMGLEICPYCNEALIHNLSDRSYADLDHFYSQSNFPLFTLSFSNFVPSCSICNRTLKTSSVTRIINPKIESFGDTARFRINDAIELLRYNDVNVDISIDENIENAALEKINGSIDMFDLIDRYNHSDIKKIARNYFEKAQTDLNDNYKRSIGKIKPKVLSMSEKEYIQYVFEIDFDETNVLNNRLGKFRLDLINQLTRD